MTIVIIEMICVSANCAYSVDENRLYIVPQDKFDKVFPDRDNVYMHKLAQIVHTEWSKYEQKLQGVCCFRDQDGTKVYNKCQPVNRGMITEMYYIVTGEWSDCDDSN